MGLKDKWTAEEETLAKVMFAAKVDDATFLAKVGRTKAAANTHFSYIAHGKPHRERRPAKREKKPLEKVGGANCSVVHRPTEEMIRDARQRSSAPRPLTSWLNGDPPPGSSALDKKNAESHTS